jgi:hypothetical protein
MPEQPEPNGWELLRGLKDLKDSIDKMAAGMVTMTTFTIHQQSVAKDIQDTRDASAGAIAETRATLATLQNKVDGMEANRGRQQFQIILSMIGSVAALGTAIILAILEGKV